MAVLSKGTISQATPYQQPARLSRSQARSLTHLAITHLYWALMNLSWKHTALGTILDSGLKIRTLRRQAKEKLNWLELFSSKPEEELTSHTWLPWCSRRSMVSTNTATHLYKGLCGGLCKHLQCFPRCFSKLLSSPSSKSNTPSCVAYLCYYILPNGRVVLWSFLCLPLKFYHKYIRVNKKKTVEWKLPPCDYDNSNDSTQLGKRLTEEF